MPIIFPLYHLQVGDWCQISGEDGRVWGNDATDLTSEHWGYLSACAGVTFLSIRCPRVLGKTNGKGLAPGVR